MPKKVKLNNPAASRLGSRSGGTSRTAESVKSLLSRASHSALARVAEQRQSQTDWREWLGSKLPADLGPRVRAVVERDGNLVVFAESSAWSARLRFAIAELESQLRAGNSAIRSIAVKVMPRA
jgi:predicted nucleic acid-binding Zn ribbon protein